MNGFPAPAFVHTELSVGIYFYILYFSATYNDTVIVVFAIWGLLLEYGRNIHFCQTVVLKRRLCCYLWPNLNVPQRPLALNPHRVS